MSKEIELKLRLAPSQAKQVLAHPLLSGCTPQKYKLSNTYYDTPELDLRQRGIALRLRQKGWSVWLMTVKGGDCGAGGLAQRNEWEAPTQPGVFDFGIVTDQGLREFLEAHHSRLIAVFSTDFTRTAWNINYGASVIEVALDRGRIDAVRVSDNAVPAREKLCELELELVEGASPDALFDLAIALATDVPLHPEILSKAERGYALIDGILASPVKSYFSPVTGEMSPIQAFRSITLSSLAQLQRNEPGAIAGSNPEYIHQSRAAICRMCSALKLFSPALTPGFVGVYLPRWQALAERLGSARAWGAFLNETLVPLESAFPDDADLAVLRTRSESNKVLAQKAAAVALEQKDYSQLLLAFSAALFRAEYPTIEEKSKLSVLKLRKFATRRLKKRAAMIESLVGNSGKMDVKRGHELRIAFKKLRYALDFFAPVLSSKRLAAYQDSLVTIQDLLGTLNDQVTASLLIKEVHPKGELDPLTRGWIAGRTELLLGVLDSELRRFMKRKKP